jgi:hypothetical protein
MFISSAFVVQTQLTAPRIIRQPYRLANRSRFYKKATRPACGAKTYSLSSRNFPTPLTQINKSLFGRAQPSFS